MFQLNSKNPSGGNREYFYKIPRVGVAWPISVKTKDVEINSLTQVANQQRRWSCDQVREIEEKRDLREQVDNIIGHDHGFLGPFGWKKCK